MQFYALSLASLSFRSGSLNNCAGKVAMRGNCAIVLRLCELLLRTEHVYIYCTKGTCSFVQQESNHVCTDMGLCVCTIIKWLAWYIPDQKQLCGLLNHSPNSACTKGFWRLFYRGWWNDCGFCGWSAPAHFCCYLQYLVHVTSLPCTRHARSHSCLL